MSVRRPAVPLRTPVVLRVSFPQIVKDQTASRGVSKVPEGAARQFRVPVFTTKVAGPLYRIVVAPLDDLLLEQQTPLGAVGVHHLANAVIGLSKLNPLPRDSAVNKSLSKKSKPPPSGVPVLKPWKPAHTQPARLQPFEPAQPAKIVMQQEQRH